VHIEGIHASNNVANGIEVTGAAVVRDCTAGENGMNGIRALDSTVIGCVAADNMGNGFTLADCSITACAAASNGEDGIRALGSVVSECTSTRNAEHGIVATNSRVSDCTASINGMSGIEGVFGAMIEGCYAQLNDANGIAVDSDCYVRNNTCDANDGAGVFASADDNRIEGNNAHDNLYGIDADGQRNIVVRNHARGNTQNYGQINAGNIKGAIVSDQDAMNAAENDLVNFSF
jgi:parallel beta-helix repeat protein